MASVEILKKMSCNLSKALIISIPFIVLICGMPSERNYESENRIHITTTTDGPSCDEGSWNLDSYNKALRVCKDCQDLFRQKTMCPDKCFTSNYFKGCMEALQFNETSIDEMRLLIQNLAGIPLKWIN